MTAKMTVVYLDQTGHVLAALREPDSGPPKLEALVGSGFLLRSVRRRPGQQVNAQFDLPASILKSKSIALDDRVIANPQAFAIDSDRLAQLPDPPATLPGLPGLTQATVTVDAGANVSADTKVLSIVRSDSTTYHEQRIQAGTIKAGSSGIILNLAIAPDGPDAAVAAATTYAIAIAIAGYPLAYRTDAI